MRFEPDRWLFVIQTPVDGTGQVFAAKRGWVLRGLGRPGDAEAIEAEVRQAWPATGTTPWWQRVEEAATELASPKDAEEETGEDDGS